MKQKLLLLFPVLAALLLLAGCGGGGGSSPGAAKNTLEDSEKCIGCHDGTNSDHSTASNWNTPGTGKPIVGEWKASTHNTNNGASCQDCHGSGYAHPASCNKCHSIGLTGSSLVLNPDAGDKCANCHAKVNPRPGKFDGFNPLTYSDPLILSTSVPTTAYTHFSTGKRANYVSTYYKQNCRKCHNPHDTSSGKQQRHDWAQSGHGATTTGPRTNSDFKTRGSLLPASVNYGESCVRCHTSTGPIKFITSGFTDVAKLPLPATDTSREVTACNVCHDDGSGYAYGYKVRKVDPVTVYYNYSAKLTAASVALGGQSHISVSKSYPDIASSNVCLVCHVGREIGGNITAAKAQKIDFTNIVFISSHYLTAGASLFQISGYEYAGRDYASQGAYPHLHRLIGIANNYGTGTDGPCVTCHLKPARHTFLPVTLGDNAVAWQRPVTGIASPECGKCHGNNPSGAIGLPALSVVSMNNAKDGFFASLEALRVLLGSKGMFYGRGGIKTTSGLGTNVTNWEKYGAGSGPDTMGAAFNYVLLSYDYGAYAHNSIYAKRLLYDAIDYLSDGSLNYNTCTYLSTLPVAYGYLCNNVTTNTLAERP